MKKGGDVSATDLYGCTVFHLAVNFNRKSSEEESERLLRKLVSLPSLPPHLPHQIHNYDRLPTHSASAYNNVRGLRLLVEELEVSVTAADNVGDTPAHVARRPEALLYLIVFCGVDVNAKSHVSDL